jgi:hypothetical protein
MKFCAVASRVASSSDKKSGASGGLRDSERTGGASKPSAGSEIERLRKRRENLGDEMLAMMQQTVRL